MLRNLSRPLIWGLALAIGVLVAAWRPALAQATGAREMPPSVQAAHWAAVFESPRPIDEPFYADECPSHLAESETAHHRGPSWHRGTGRRSQRDPSGLALPSSRAGSIPAADPLYSQRPAWHLVPRPPVHGTGQLAAPPRAPPR